MSNIQLNKDNKRKANLISAEDIDRSNNIDSSEFFDDLNATLVDDIDKSFEKKEQQKIDDEVKEIEKSKRIKNIATIAIVVVVALIVIAVILVIVASIVKKSNYTLNLVDSGIIVEQSVKFEDTSNKFLVDSTQSDGNNDEVNEELSKYNIVTLNESDNFVKGNTVLIDVIVNTKESNEEVFSNHETQFFFTYKDLKVGYDNVIKTVENYNKDSINKITLPDKETYDNSGMDLVLFSFEVTYPKNFPTYNSDGKVFVIPTMEMSIKGKCEELLVDDNDLTNSLDRYIVVDEMVYDLSDMINVTLPHGEEVNKSATLQYNFIATLPYNTTKELYEVSGKLVVKDKEHNFNIDNTNTTVVEKTVEEVAIPSEETEELEETKTEETTNK